MISDSQGLGPNVIWTGTRKDVTAIQAASDIGVLSSHEEGFSNALLECMASSLPMVVTDVGGNAEAVIDGETGLVVPAKNPYELGQALLTLALDRNRSNMGRKGRNRIMNKFTMDICVERYELMYHQIVN
jgi:glycosyltransferase involved in cell wall biosynthesis